jgi:hypothetical protein
VTPGLLLKAFGVVFGIVAFVVAYLGVLDELRRMKAELLASAAKQSRELLKQQAFLALVAQELAEISQRLSKLDQGR